MSKKPEIQVDDAVPLFGSFAKGARYKIEVLSPETPGERSARQEHEAKDADHRRRIEWLILCVASGILAVATLVCLGVLIFTGEPASKAKLSESILTIIVSSCASGVFGFLAGKNLGR